MGAILQNSMTPFGVEVRQGGREYKNIEGYRECLSRSIHEGLALDFVGRNTALCIPEGNQLDRLRNVQIEKMDVDENVKKGALPSCK